MSLVQPYDFVCIQTTQVGEPRFEISPIPEGLASGGLA